MKEAVTWPSVFKLLLTDADGEKACFSVVSLPVYLITCLFFFFFSTKRFVFSSTKSFLCPLPTGEIESVAMYERSFQAQRKTVKVIYADFRIQFSLRWLKFYLEKASNQTDIGLLILAVYIIYPKGAWFSSFVLWTFYL